MFKNSQSEQTNFVCFVKLRLFVEKGLIIELVVVYEAVRLCRPDLLELLISNGARIKSDEAEIQEGGVRVQRSPLLCAVRLAAQDRRNR